MYTRSTGKDVSSELQFFERKSCSCILRSAGTPTCLHFGVARRKKYPGCFFCSNCDLFEREYWINKKIKPRSARFKDIAGHDNWILPSTMIDNLFNCFLWLVLLKYWYIDNVGKRNIPSSIYVVNNSCTCVVSSSNDNDDNGIGYRNVWYILNFGLCWRDIVITWYDV